MAASVFFPDDMVTWAHFFQTKTLCTFGDPILCFSLSSNFHIKMFKFSFYYKFYVLGWLHDIQIHWIFVFISANWNFQQIRQCCLEMFYTFNNFVPRISEFFEHPNLQLIYVESNYSIHFHCSYRYTYYNSSRTLCLKCWDSAFRTEFQHFILKFNKISLL
jgi:hypothetical protein